MARQSSVQAAYTPLRGSNGGWSRLIASVAIAAFIVFFLSSGGNTSVNDDNLRSGQAHHDTTSIRTPVAPQEAATETTSSSNEYIPEGTVDALVDEENLEEAVDEVTNDIQEAEEEEIRKEESMLSSAVDGVSNLLRIRMGKRFGNTLNDTEVEEVATQIEDQLQTEVSNGLRTEAEAIAKREIDAIDSNVEMEEEAGYAEKVIKEDVYDQEEVAVDRLIEDIDVAAERVKDTMETRAAEIEKQVLELRLTAKLGKQVKLVIVDDEVRPGVDDVNLTPPVTAAVPANPYGSAISTSAYGTSPVSAQVPEENASAQVTAPSYPNTNEGETNNNALFSAEQQGPANPYGSAVSTPAYGTSPVSPFPGEGETNNNNALFSAEEQGPVDPSAETAAGEEGEEDGGDY